MFLQKIKRISFFLILISLAFVKPVSADDSNAKISYKEYKDGVFYDENGLPANWWYDDGSAWYFFQNGKKHTGYGKDASGEKYFANGKYANGYYDGIFYVDGEKANWWRDDGKAWYFFKDGKKYTGYGKDASGEKYFVNGKYANGEYIGKLFKEGKESKGKEYINGIFYDENGLPANWWYDDGSAWYFFQNGKKHTGYGKDASGEKYFVNGKYANGYYDGIFYVDGEKANWWRDDGKAWYFFKDGKKYTGYGKDANGEKYFVNGKYANGEYIGKLFKEGKESKGKEYINGIFYDENKKPANWWCDDGSAWYFFQNGKKHTGYGRDASGEKYFVNGKYANGYYDGIFYVDGEKANWWRDDGKAWYFFKDGKKYTGYGKDANGEKYFVNGKYANGEYIGKLFKEGKESKGKEYINGIFYDENRKPANWWCNDGSAWYFFQNGKKHTGYGRDASGEKYFVNGKYANGYYISKYFDEGIEVRIPSYYRIRKNIYFYDFNQYRYYTGCWLLAASSGLYSKGIYVNPTQLLNMLPNTGDPRTGVMGNPALHTYRNGAYPASWPSGMLPTLKKLLPTAEDISGASVDRIKFEISRGNPVQIWYSRVEPNIPLNAGNGTFYASSDYHSILLTGYDASGFYFVESVYRSTDMYTPYNSDGSADYRYLLNGYERFGRKAIVYR